MNQEHNQNQPQVQEMSLAIIPIEGQEKEETKTDRIYQIWQVRETAPNFNRPLPSYWTNPRIRSEVFRKVGEVRTHRLEEAYYMTQNLDYGWGGPNDPNHAEGNVSKFVTGLCRSTGVGDVIVVSEPGRTFSNPAFMINTQGFIDVAEPRIRANY